MGNKTQVACLYVIPMSLEMQFTQKLKVYQHPHVVLKLKINFHVTDFQCMDKIGDIFQNIFFYVPVIQV